MNFAAAERSSCRAGIYTLYTYYIMIIYILYSGVYILRIMWQSETIYRRRLVNDRVCQHMAPSDIDFPGKNDC